MQFMKPLIQALARAKVDLQKPSARKLAQDLLRQMVKNGMDIKSLDEARQEWQRKKNELAEKGKEAPPLPRA